MVGSVGLESTTKGNHHNSYGVPQDYVRAHMWYDIAGVAVAVSYRDYVAREMASAQVAEAQRLASEWTGSYLGQAGEVKTQMATRQSGFASQ